MCRFPSLHPEVVAKLLRDPNHEFILPDNSVIGEVAVAKYPREDFDFSAIDLEKLKEVWKI